MNDGSLQWIKPMFARTQMVIIVIIFYLHNNHHNQPTPMIYGKINDEQKLWYDIENISKSK